MNGLTDHVAQAIMQDQTCGGADILRPEEIDALMRAAVLLKESGDPEGCDCLRLLAVDLGQSAMPHLYPHLPKLRVNRYYQHCAEVSIRAYDAWLAQRSRERQESR